MPAREIQIGRPYHHDEGIFVPQRNVSEGFNFPVYAGTMFRAPYRSSYGTMHHAITYEDHWVAVSGLREVEDD